MGAEKPSVRVLEGYGGGLDMGLLSLDDLGGCEVGDGARYRSPEQTSRAVERS